MAIYSIESETEEEGRESIPSPTKGIKRGTPSLTTRASQHASAKAKKGTEEWQRFFEQFVNQEMRKERVVKMLLGDDE